MGVTRRRPAAALKRVFAARRAGAGTLLLLLLFLAPTLTAAAAPTPSLDSAQQAHLQALREARAALDAPRQADATRASRALDILQTRAEGEREAIASLQLNPPGIETARIRLDTSIAGFKVSARDPDPAASRQRLDRILADPRYHPEQGPVAGFARFANGVLNSILQALFTSRILQALGVLLLVAVIAGVVLMLVPALRQPLTRGRRAGGAPGTPGDLAVPQYFRDAEALAAAGDYAGAVRALAAGTMELVSGQRSFTASPFTVRETFRRSGQPETLRPLLLAFERSYYGHHEATIEDYRQAAAAASAYRASGPREAAA